MRPSSSPSTAATATAGNAPRAVGEGDDLAIKYLEFCVNELKLKVCVRVRCNSSHNGRHIRDVDIQ